MQVKELISEINSFDVKVVFDEPKYVAERLTKGEYILYFTPVDGKERKKYIHLKNKEGFKSTTAAIHIPDLSIEHLIDVYKSDVSGIYEFTKELLQEYCDNEINNDIIYTIYLFLHEVGHWIQFCNVQKDIERYIHMDEEITKANFEKMSLVNAKRADRLNKGGECLLTAKEKRLYKECMEEYREIPKEKAADQFAIGMLPRILDTFSVKCT